jgi:hypothetical protein
MVKIYVLVDQNASKINATDSASYIGNLDKKRRWIYEGFFGLAWSHK